MADLLNIGASALLSLQRAISTTGNNIANANTPGYTRQDVLFAATPAERQGDSYLGTGVRIDAVRRNFDQFLASDVQSRTSASSGLNLLSDFSARLDALLGDADVGISPALNDLFGALEGVASDPASLPARQVLLGEAEVLAQRIQGLDRRLSDFGAEIGARLEAGVREINTLAANVASLNEQISLGVATTGSASSGLLDSRDRALEELSSLVGVTVVPRNDGAVNVMIGNGQSLVVGSDVTELAISRDPTDATRLNVVLADAPAQGPIDRFISGGELGAALSFRGGVLDSARRELGVLATGLAMTFNSQHRAGVDLQGQMGGDFFAPPEPVVLPAGSNSAGVTLTAELVDAAALTGADYRLDYDGSQWTLRNQQTGASQVLPSGSSVVDGVRFDLPGAAVAGDSFLVQPTAQAASRFGLALSSPAGIAVAGPLQVAADPANLGSANLGPVSAGASAALPLGSPVVLTFDPDALGPGLPGYQVSGAAGGPLAYDPAVDAAGKVVSLGDLQFRLSGEPVAGDSFSLRDTPAGSSDNRNGLALAELQAAPTLAGGTASYQDAYSTLVSGVAVASRQAQSEADTASVMLAQSVSARESVQGVNLDEEAANLLRYQQAYQAAAQVIAVADTLFQTLLAATRR